MITTEKAKTHIANLIASIDRSYRRVLLGKAIKASEIYLYDILFNLLDECCTPLTSREKTVLTKMYNRLPSVSDQVCQSFVKEFVQPTSFKKFTQAEPEDCVNDGNSNKVYFWQDTNVANSTNTIYTSSLVANFYNGKSNDILSNFNSGREINYHGVGKIAFTIMDIGDKTLKVYDKFNNEVTDAFDRFYTASTRSVTLVSKVHYAYGDIQFKIH